MSADWVFYVLLAVLGAICLGIGWTLGYERGYLHGRQDEELYHAAPVRQGCPVHGDTLRAPGCKWCPPMIRRDV